MLKSTNIQRKWY